ncbi:MAG: hypothetical protein D9C04_00760, partial [Nitrosopumilus sp. B06]
MEEQVAKKIARIGSIAGIVAVVALAVMLILPNATDAFIRGHDIANEDSIGPTLSVDSIGPTLSVDSIGPTLSVDNYCPELLRQGDFCFDTAPTVDADDPYLDMLKQGDFYRNITPTINVDDPYLELLKQGDSYLDMTSDEQEAYIQAINEMRTNHNAYEREVWKLFDSMSLLELRLQAADEVSDQDLMELIGLEMYALLKTLETYGVTTLEEVHKNPYYWESKAIATKNRINGQTHVNTDCIFNPIQLCDNIDSIVPTHADNLSIENRAIIWYPVLELGIIPVPLVVISVASGPGTVTAKVALIPISGTTEFKSMVCPKNDPHDSLRVHLSSTERLYHITVNTPYYEKSNQGWKTFDPQRWFFKCVEFSHLKG